MNKKNRLGNSPAIKVFTALAALLALIYLFSVFTTANLSNAINEKAAAFEAANKPVELELLSIVDSSCPECVDLSPLTEQLKQTKFVKLTREKTLDFSSPEAKGLINRLNIRKSPAIVLLGDVNDKKLSGLWNDSWKLGGENQGGGWAYFKSAPAPYTDTETGRVKGLVSSTTIIDSSCEKCFSIEQVNGFFERNGVKFSEKKTIKAGSDEALRLIGANGIKTVPALVVSADVLEYPFAEKFFQQMGIKESNGYFAIHSVFPPYKEIETGEVRGLVDVIYLKDNSCGECFEATQQGNLLSQLGIIINSEETLDVSSERGKGLVEKYGIKKVPAMIISPGISLYAGLGNAWSQVGSVEEDGWYVFQKPEIIGTYKGLA